MNGKHSIAKSEDDALTVELTTTVTRCCFVTFLLMYGKTSMIDICTHCVLVRMNIHKGVKLISSNLC